MEPPLRPAQAAVIEHFLRHGGKVGVSAVPGSGKTYTLSRLAARLVIEKIEPRQEVLIVTLVNAAVDNFRQRISMFVRELGLLQGMGYRVRTLHGLAHDIVRQRPALVGLAEDFVIVDDRECAQILEAAVNRWIQHHPDSDQYIAWDRLPARSAEAVRKYHWPALALDVTRSFIKRAKDLRHDAGDLSTVITARGNDLPLAEMSLAIYFDYRSTLAARGGVDFDDLIGFAYQILSLDTDLLARLQQAWPYILEDEAQDSSQAQEDILRLLTDHPQSNWIRVGDPNQSIYNTFTNASPEHLRRFLSEDDVASFELPDSGRSQPSVIRLANHLIDWTREHEVDFVQNALSLPHIRPTAPDDPQPNPPDEPEGIRLLDTAFTPDSEQQIILESVQRWFDSDLVATGTIAVLVPSNRRGAKYSQAFKDVGLPVAELLDTTPATRSAAGVLGNALKHLAEPTSRRQLATLFRAWQRDQWDEADQHDALRKIYLAILKMGTVEGFLWPYETSEDGLAGTLEASAQDEIPLSLAGRFRALVQNWQRAASLPIDQLVLLLARDLFSEPADLALAYKLAAELKHRQRLNPTWRLPELAGELASIARNERRFMGFSDKPYEPSSGEVTIATMHRAKGLEWDRVYVTAVNNYDFPLGEEGDVYIAEKWFVRDRLNLVAEGLAQLDCLTAQDGNTYSEGEATLKARAEYISERLRLLYVAITRARRQLVMTWNQGRGANAISDGSNRPKLHQATAFVKLSRWWDEQTDEP
jgi:DNA helicase II / ATP-dependent DNA helicase PcrA